VALLGHVDAPSSPGLAFTPWAPISSVAIGDDIPTVAGPILKDLESHADYPADVAAWYETMAHEVIRALVEADAHEGVAAADALWSGPRPDPAGP
jgi:hypothetical protein